MFYTSKGVEYVGPIDVMDVIGYGKESEAVRKRYEEEYAKRIAKVGSNRKKKIAQYSLYGDLIEVFENAKDAADATGGRMENIVSCALGRQTSSNGYVWKFEE